MERRYRKGERIIFLFVLLLISKSIVYNDYKWEEKQFRVHNVSANILYYFKCVCVAMNKPDFSPSRHFNWKAIPPSERLIFFFFLSCLHCCSGYKVLLKRTNKFVGLVIYLLKVGVCHMNNIRWTIKAPKISKHNIFFNGWIELRKQQKQQINNHNTHHIVNPIEIKRPVERAIKLVNNNERKEGIERTLKA